jgi:frataxin-like iron-binding protein CyaY
MAKLTIEDASRIAKETFKDSIPHIEDSLNDVLKDSPIDIEVKQAILNRSLLDTSSALTPQSHYWLS